MNAMDLEINRGVRRVLVRHWIDLGRVSIRTFDGKVQIRGEMDRIAGVKEPLTGSLMESMFTEIRRVRGVVRVTVNLENWSNDSGLWQPVGGGGQPGSGILGVVNARTGPSIAIARGASAAGSDGAA